MNTQINMKELETDYYKKLKRKNDIFISVLKDCHKKIKYNSKLERCYCFYLIPEFIFGTPLYNVVELTNFIIKKLTENGFKVMYFDPNWIFINWEFKKKTVSDMTPKIIPKNPTTQYRSIDEYKPTNINNVYSDASLLAFQDKSISLTNQ